MEKLLTRIAAQKAQAPSAATSTQNAPSFAGTWQNELGSQMTLQVQAGQVTGTYTSAVGDAPQPMPLTGFVQGNLISFTVNFEVSLACWAGQLEQGLPAPTIYTMWYLVVDAAIWESTSAGCDTFVLVSE